MGRSGLEGATGLEGEGIAMSLPQNPAPDCLYVLCGGWGWRVPQEVLNWTVPREVPDWRVTRVGLEGKGM